MDAMVNCEREWFNGNRVRNLYFIGAAFLPPKIPSQDRQRDVMVFNDFNVGTTSNTINASFNYGHGWFS